MVGRVSTQIHVVHRKWVGSDESWGGGRIVPTLGRHWVRSTVGRSWGEKSWLIDKNQTRGDKCNQVFSFYLFDCSHRDNVCTPVNDSRILVGIWQTNNEDLWTNHHHLPLYWHYQNWPDAVMVVTNSLKYFLEMFLARDDIVIGWDYNFLNSWTEIC